MSPEPLLAALGGLRFDLPWALLLLPLALLPLLRPMAPAANHPWLDLVPADRLSALVSLALRLLGAAAVAATALALAGPYRAEVAEERLATGAEIVLLLDRSRSMDEPFGTDPNSPAFSGRAREPKGRVARQVLADFVAGRPKDSFALVVFSTFPLRVLDFTRKAEVVQAGIAAGEIGRGLAETDIGRALLAALDGFADRPYNGSRIVLLVSDGGAQLDPMTQDRIRQAMQRHKVGLYWIYIRSFRSVGLGDPEKAEDEGLGQYDTAGPERSLHRFFAHMGTPYRAYEAIDPEALRHAIDDVGRAESRPIRYTELLPRRDFAPACLAVALASTLVLLGLRLSERGLSA